MKYAHQFLYSCFILVISLLIYHGPALSNQNNGLRTVKLVAKDNSIALANDIIRSRVKLSKIWPGYWPKNQSFIINMPNKGALLITEDSNPESFKPMKKAELPDSLHGITYFHDSSLPDVVLPFYLNYSIGGGRTAILVNTPNKNSNYINPIDGIKSLLFHEQFHAYQSHAFINDSFINVKPADIKNRVDFAVSAEIERRILIHALSTDNKRLQIQLLKNYFTIRRTRESNNPDKVAKAEKQFERYEGTAEFAEQSALAIIDGGSDSIIRASLIKELEKNLISNGGIYTTTWIRSKSYGIGAALTYFIDKYDNKHWHSKIENGVLLDQYLESLLSLNFNEKPCKSSDKIYKEYDYKNIYNSFRPVIVKNEKLEIKTVEEFLSLTPYKVVLDLNFNNDKSTTGFTGENMFPLDTNTIAISNAILFNSVSDSHSITVKNHPVLLENKRYTVLLLSPPSITNNKHLPFGQHKLQNIKISMDDIDVIFHKESLVNIEKNTMTIKLLE